MEEQLVPLLDYHGIKCSFECKICDYYQSFVNKDFAEDLTKKARMDHINSETHNNFVKIKKLQLLNKIAKLLE